MSHCRVGCTKVFSLACLLFLVTVFSGTSALAQDRPVPKVDVFVGYQWLNPGGTVPDQFGNPFKLPSLIKGFGTSVTYNFDKNWGLSADFGGNYKSSVNEQTFSVGPRYMWRAEGVNVFAHTLLSLNLLDVANDPNKHGIGAVLGGGLDLPVNKYFSWRVFEADYVWARQNYSSLVTDPSSHLRRPELGGARLRTGLVIDFGGAPELAPAAACAAQPSEVMVGEPVTVTVTPSNFNPKHKVDYTYSSTGGKITPKDSAATVDTTGMTGGSYTVTATGTDARQKKNNVASCNASFSVKEPPKNPPVISCSANPASVVAGAASTVTCECKSPDGVPVTVSNWTASSGKLSGSGNVATEDTTGASGTVTIGATCTDSRGLTGSSSASLNVENPPPPVNPEIAVLEAKLALHSVYFATAQPTKAKPNGGLVASQQATLTALASDFQKYLADKAGTTPAPHLILEGHADPRGGAVYNQALSERRVDRTKNFLVEHGVPADDIETKALGDQHNLTADEVQASVDQDPQLTPREKARVMKNKRTIILASNRRVDVSLNTTGQTSVRQFPFNAEDALTLIGGREKPKAVGVAKKPLRKKKKM
jgi:outer membrane protein OmpA-like peptidoglycan-associated protein